MASSQQPSSRPSLAEELNAEEEEEEEDEDGDEEGDDGEDEDNEDEEQQHQRRSAERDGGPSPPQEQKAEDEDENEADEKTELEPDEEENDAGGSMAGAVISLKGRPSASSASLSAGPAAVSTFPPAASPSGSPSSAPPAAPSADGEWAQATEAEEAQLTAASAQVRSPTSARSKKRQADDEQTAAERAAGQDEHEPDEQQPTAAAAAKTAAGGEQVQQQESGGQQEDDEDDEEEEDEDDDDEEEDDEEDEEDEEEPILKYSRVGADVSRLLHSTASHPPLDTARCLLPHSKFLILGTSSGAVYTLDLSGNEIGHQSPHSAPVNDLSLDSSGEFVASASMDGSVCIHNLYSRETTRHALGSNVLSVSLPAGFKQSQMFAAGLQDGRLIVNKRGWFSANNYTIHSGEGAVRAVRWRRELIAWSNDFGVKVYDVNSSERLAHIKFDKEDAAAAASASPVSASACSCSLHWSADDELMIAFGRSVKVAKVKERAATRQERQQHPDRLHVRFVQISALFTVDFAICGIAHYEADIVLLALPDAEPEEDKEQETKEDRPEVPRPELRIVTRAGAEVRVDVLPVHGFEICSEKDYSLRSLQEDDTGSGSSANSSSASSACFFVVAPHDILTARPRDADDHITFLHSQERYHDALLFVQQQPPPALHSHSRQSVVDAYLEHLFSIHSYAQCAAECSRLLGLNQQLWEQWIHRFQQQHRLSFIVTAVPTFNPQLSAAVYEEILLYFLDPANKEERDKQADKEAAEQQQESSVSASNGSSGGGGAGEDDDGYNVNLSVLLKLITSWPKHIYDTQALIAAIKSRLASLSASASGSPPPALLEESLAELYLINKQYHLALSVYFRLRRHDIFTLIRDLGLFHVVSDRLLQLMAFDSTQAVRLLVDNHERCGVEEVMSQLRGHPQYQFLYLHHLNRRFDYQVPDLSSQHADLLLSLYADYDEPELLHFLRVSHAYNVDAALALCERRGLHRELIFLYKQMGNSQLALRIILHQLRSVHMAIQFVEEERDELLWEELISHCVQHSEMLGELLLYVGEYAVDLVKLVQRVPAGLEITGLKGKLVGIMRDYALQLEVLKAGSRVMQGDVEAAVEERRQREAEGVLVERCNICRLTVVGQTAGRAAGRKQRRPRRKRGEAAEVDASGSAATSQQEADLTVVVFFCYHAFHRSCLLRAHREKRGAAAAAAGTGSVSPPELSTKPLALSCIRCWETQLGANRRYGEDRGQKLQQEVEVREPVKRPAVPAPAASASASAGRPTTLTPGPPTIATAQPVARPAQADKDRGGGGLAPQSRSQSQQQLLVSGRAAGMHKR